MAPILTLEEARRVVEKQASTVRAKGAENVALLAGQGRVLAEPIFADRDLPPFSRATRDGYALRAADVAQIPAQLELIGELKAGDSPDPRRHSITRGQAVSIMTGAALPPGADATVMVEHTTLSGMLVEVRRSVAAGENLVPRGAEARAGQLLLDCGARLDHAAIALAASVGKSHLQVYRRPRIALLATGDEVVDVDASPGPAQIRNSNTYSLAAQVKDAGAEPVLLPIAPDEPDRLRALIAEGLDCDLLLLSGGVSAGKYDLVENVLNGLNANFHFTGAHIQPGKPIVFGSCEAPGASAPSAGSGQAFARESTPRKYFFGLPGNPVSTMVTFELFVRPLLEALSGMKPRPLIFVNARLKSEIRTKTGLKRFLPAVLMGEFEHAQVELVRWYGSGDIAALAHANCYLVIPPDCETISAGEWVSLLLR